MGVRVEELGYLFHFLETIHAGSTTPWKDLLREAREVDAGWREESRL